MAVSATQDRSFEIPPGMKGPLVFSGLLHVGIVVIAIVGLPYFKSEPLEMPHSIPVEILPIAEMTTTNRIPLKAPPKPAEEVKEKPPEKEKPKAPPKVDQVEPPKDLPKPVKEKPKPKPVAPPPPTEKLVEPEPKPIEKPKPEEKPVEPQEQQQFDNLLKNLQDSEPEVDETLPEAKEADAPAPAPDVPYAETMTMSEADALAQQLQRCWSIQAGARYAEDLVVDVRLTVSPEKRVLSATIVDQWRYGQDSYFRAAADSAIRAVHSPQCEILILPDGKYNLWKDIVVTFDPREML